MANRDKASGTTTASSRRGQPPGARIRIIREPADLDALPHLDDEDRAVGLEMFEEAHKMGMKPITNTVGMWLNDPKFEQAYHLGYHSALLKLCQDLHDDPKNGNYITPGTVMNLLFLSVGKHFHWTWGIGAMATVMPMVDGFNAEQIFMLDFPESEIWNDEQRLALIFAKAVLTLTVSDELMAQAIEMWGTKLTIRYLGLIGSLTSQAFFMSAFNVAGRWNDTPGTEDVMVHGANTGDWYYGDEE